MGRPLGLSLGRYTHPRGEVLQYLPLNIVFLLGKLLLGKFLASEVIT